MNKVIVFCGLIIFLVACKSIPKNETVEIESTAAFTKEKVLRTALSEAKVWLDENEGNPDFELNEETLNAFGYHLLYDLNSPSKALKIFKLICDVRPESSNAFDSAAEALLANGEFEKSVEYYQKSIELNGRVQFHQLGYLIPQEYQQTAIPSDTLEIFEALGNWDNEIAFVYVQGGPDLQLNIGRRDGLHLMPNHDELLKIYPLQAQMINPQVLATKPLLTEKQSAFENSVSVEILHRVIEYLVNQNKRVFLIGHSYGASISMEYVNSKKSLAEKVVLMGLDLDEDISSWKSLKSGEYIRWENGLRPYALIVFQEIPEQHPSKKDFDRIADNLAILVGTNMAKKYTSLYSDDDFKKLISVYSDADEANGIKSNEEISILNDKGSSVVRIRGDHHDMLNTAFMSALYNNLMHKVPLNSSY